jgi:predicted transcriptional regulator of viral defense system
MQTLTEHAFLLAPPGGLFTDTVVANLFPAGTLGARRLMLHRAVAAGEILRLKRGIYLLAPPYRRSEPHPFAIAAILHPGSHISLESALAHHGLIPEGVVQVSSVTTARSRAFTTPAGLFSFDRVPADNPSAGVEATRLDRQFWAFIATPLRAIADMVYLRREVSWHTHGIAFLTDSLRIEEDDLARMPMDRADEIGRGIRSARVREFIRELRRSVS